MGLLTEDIFSPQQMKTVQEIMFIQKPLDKLEANGTQDLA
jgi:hypothetical protein